MSHDSDTRNKKKRLRREADDDGAARLTGYVDGSGHDRTWQGDEEAPYVRNLDHNYSGRTDKSTNQSIGANSTVSVTLADIGAAPGDKIRVSVTKRAHYLLDGTADASTGDILPPNSVEFIDIAPGQETLSVHNTASSAGRISVSKVNR